MPNPLPIFRLPQLVLTKVVNLMSPMEQILVASCSKKAFALIKAYHCKLIRFSLRKCAKFHIGIYDERYEPVELYADLFKNDEKEKSDKNDIRFVISDSLRTYWEDPNFGFKKILEFLNDLFPIDIGYLHITCPEDIWVIDWCKNHQKIPHDVFVYDQGRAFPAEPFKYILENCTSDQLRLHTHPPHPFEIQNFDRKFGKFTMEFGNWMTVPNLISLDCVEILVRKQFSSSEVNQFLKHWINGGSARLKFLKVRVEEYNDDEVLAEIQNHLNRGQGIRTYISPYNSKFTFGGLQLRRNDGKTASILYVPITEEFFLGVWPDASGST